MTLIKYKYAGCCLIAFILLSHLLSCGKKEQTSQPQPLIDSVSQDPNYRLGKWYSVSNGAGYNFSSNPLLDTIWFTSDSVAGWTGFGGNPYVFRPTYFSGIYYIVYITPDPINTAKTDTILHQCGMLGDTFVIFWITSGQEVFPEHYVKMKS